MAPSRRQRQVLFLQLPVLDNDTAGSAEQVPLAALYLRHAVAASPEDGRHACHLPPPESQADDNRALVARILAARPDVIAATLYLWNIERTLRVLAAVRRARPETAVVVGGPEVARPHPFLFRSAAVDVVVVGEGETVFAPILRALRTGRPTDFANTAWRAGAGWRWGRTPPPPVQLGAALPPPADPMWQPDAGGIAYLETTRGCPLRCTFCRYHHLRRDTHALDPADVAARVAVLSGRGAREIRFIDPTFNCHPRFDAVVAELARVNRGGRVRFFAELKADAIDAARAEALHRANFTEIEVGLQSVDPAVLRAVRRPTRLAALDAGIRHLTRRGIRVTLDVMYGLPLQTLDDVHASIRWGRGRRRVHLQCLQTLLLPGTDLRRDAARWGLRGTARPPYGVRCTAALGARDIAAIERYLYETPGLPADLPTPRFVGRRLPDLFSERIALGVPEALPRTAVPGRTNRRAWLLRGTDLFAHRDALARLIRRAARAEPDVLWQFVLCPSAEEPLDLLDALAAELRAAPPHLLDRYAVALAAGRLMARRLYVQLPPGRRLDPAWAAAAEAFLRERFY